MTPSPEIEKPGRRRLRWLVLVFLASAVGGGAWFGFLRWELDPKVPGGWIYTRREHQNRVSFDSEKWKKFPRSSNEWPHTLLLPVRIRMVDDLLKHHDLHGQSREQVETLLGPRTKTEYFSDWDLVYYLGPGRYGNAVGDSEWLVFRFDSTGHVQEYRVVHD